MKLDCLHNVIGLSQSDCPCLPEIGDIDPAVSYSGQYMDNLEHGVSLASLDASKDCGHGNVWALMNAARAEAIEDFHTQLLMAISVNNRFKYDNYSGTIGEISRKGNARRSGTRTINGTYIEGLRKGYMMNLCITSILLGIDQAGDYDVTVSDVISGDVIDTVSVTVGNNRTGSTSTNINLPLSDGYGNANCYALSFDRNGGQILNYKYHCGCSGVPLHNWQQDKVFKAKGFSVNDIADIDTNCNGDYSGGIVAKFKLKCPVLDWMCEEDQDFWCDSLFGKIAAKAMVLMANAKLIASILDSGKIGFYTLLGVEALAYRRDKYISLASELITMLSTELLPQKAKDCLSCQSSNNMSVNTILA